MKSTRIAIIVLCIILALPGCSDDDNPASIQETIGAPAAPLGCDSTAVGNLENFSSTGAISSVGHDLEHRFDWGDGNVSQWAYSLNASHSWFNENNYNVKVQARCATHTDKISAWSAAKPVSVGEAITIPDIPDGVSRTDVGESESYSTGGSTSSLGHNIEYRFDWGDGNQSPWASSSSASYMWSIEGIYDVRAQARCAAHADKNSPWSDGITVEVGETISIPAIPNGLTTVTVDRIEMYCSGSSSSSRGHPVLYQFDWEGNAFPLWSSSNCASIYWPTVGNFSLRVRARCALHAQAVSDWTDSQSVLISSYEIVTTPNIPSGPASTHVGETETYSVSGAYSSSGHRIEFQFDWGDGSLSSWSTSYDASHSWSVEGQYVITIQARCVDHIGRFSSWSDGLTVSVEP